MAQEIIHKQDEMVSCTLKKPCGRATLQRNLLYAHQQYPKVSHNHEHKIMGTSLSFFGKVWAVLSFIAMGSACVGFCLPYWIRGRIFNQMNSTLGVFRRCNYPILTEHGEINVVTECGRYSSFSEIPSIWWQVATISIGFGCCFSILVVFAALLACCMKDVLSHAIAKFIGALQFIAALFIATGCILYPFGWDSSEVRQVCGPDASYYQLGTCRISWAYYSTIGGAVGTLMCSLLSCSASKHRYSGYQS